MTRDKLVESMVRARGAFLIAAAKAEGFTLPEYDDMEPYQQHRLRMAEHAVLDALSAAGYAVVPYGATKAMQNAACSNFNKVAGLNDAIAEGNILKGDK